MKDLLDKAVSWKPAKIPVGGAAGVLVGTGLMGGVEEVIKKFLPNAWKQYSGIPLGLALAWIFENVGFFRRVLGDEFVECLAIGALFHGIESTFFVRARITGAITGLAPTPVVTSGVRTAAQPAQVQTRAPARYVTSVDEKLAATLAVS